eukprot:3894476-Amphidinium_carterae.1
MIRHAPATNQTWHCINYCPTLVKSLRSKLLPNPLVTIPYKTWTFSSPFPIPSSSSQYLHAVSHLSLVTKRTILKISRRDWQDIMKSFAVRVWISMRHEHHVGSTLQARKFHAEIRIEASDATAQLAS